jgi:hypothetical protein
MLCVATAEFAGMLHNFQYSTQLTHESRISARCDDVSWKFLLIYFNKTKANNITALSWEEDNGTKSVSLSCWQHITSETADVSQMSFRNADKANGCSQYLSLQSCASPSPLHFGKYDCRSM